VTMNRIRFVLAVGAALTAAGLLNAQAWPGRFGAGGAEAPRFGRMQQFLAIYLDLTEAQQAQAKGIFEAARASAAPLAAQLRASREEMAAAVKANQPDAELDRIASRQGALLGQLAAIWAKAQAKFYALLTPAQREKADKLRSLRGPRANRWGENLD
jgi:Spy/CpxP family protein refolding chaperone